MRQETLRPATPGEQTDSRFHLGNLRVRSRLVALILIPTLVGVLLAALQLADAVATSAEYRRLTQVAGLVSGVSGLTHDLGEERTLTAWYVAARRPPGHLARLDRARGEVDARSARTLAALDTLDQEQQPRVRRAADEMRRWLRGLPALRKAVVGESAPPRAAVRTYTSLIEILGGLQSELATVGDDRLVADATAFTSLRRAKEEIARQQAILTVALAEKRLDYDDLSDFLGSWDRQQAELDQFLAAAAPAEARLYHATVRGQSVERADAMRQRALAQLREYRTIRDLDISTRRDLTVWYTSTGVTVDLIRRVEERLAGKLLARAQELQDGEERNAVVSGTVILLLLLLVLVITSWVAGSLVRPLRRLRAEALEIAGSRLPETVRTLRESGEGELPQVASVGVTTRDEIGEVARAFDEVHREAVRLAGDEARLRANVNSIFVNLARRSQTLVERQLDLIEELEHGEEDEGRLSSLFRLDHMATRMRRNSENLLVLAGQETARKWSEPVPLVDVARASLSEVENYERVAIQIPAELEIVGPAVTDTVHLLAELIENAVSFSPRETKVTVSSSPMPEGGVLLSVTDLGIGMSAAEIGEANRRLTDPPIVDVAVARRMGLFVVGRLALRHGVQVQLRPREEGPGLSALVLLPAVLMVPASAPTQQLPAYAAASQAPAGPSPYRPPYGEQPAPGGRQRRLALLPGGEAQADGADPSVLDTPWPPQLPPPGGAEGPATPWPPVLEAFAEPDGTGPLPVIHDSVLDQDEEDLPIFTAVTTSDWFTKPAALTQPSPEAPDPAELPRRSPGATEPPPLPAPETLTTGPPHLPRDGDPSRREVRDGPLFPGGPAEPSTGGTTSNGLPRRVPKANLISGSMPSAGPLFRDPAEPVSPDRLRSRLSSFQQGVRQGREEIGEEE